MTVNVRLKKQASLIKKLERIGWPQFYYPTEIVKDLIGARIVCWFPDDCYELSKLIRSSLHFTVPTGHEELRDYQANPQAAGYRALHMFVDVAYDSVRRSGEIAEIVPSRMMAEIQIRTKLQDSWADITHEFFYKAKDAGIESKEFESFLSDLSARLAQEDKTLIKFRTFYQQLADDKAMLGVRTGFRDEDN